MSTRLGGTLLVGGSQRPSWDAKLPHTASNAASLCTQSWWEKPPQLTWPCSSQRTSRPSHPTESASPRVTSTCGGSSMMEACWCSCPSSCANTRYSHMNTMSQFSQGLHALKYVQRSTNGVHWGLHLCSEQSNPQSPFSNLALMNAGPFFLDEQSPGALRMYR